MVRQSPVAQLWRLLLVNPFERAGIYFMLPRKHPEGSDVQIYNEIVLEQAKHEVRNLRLNSGYHLVGSIDSVSRSFDNCPRLKCTVTLPGVLKGLGTLPGVVQQCF